MDYQQPFFYRFSEDSLWLVSVVAEELKGAAPRSLLDIGAGCGVVGIEISNRLESLESLVFLEKQAAFIPYIKMNTRILRDNITERIVTDDLMSWQDRTKFDLVVSNPPYFKEGHGRKSPEPKTQLCRTYVGAGLCEFASKLRSKIAPKGVGLMLVRIDNPDFLKLKDYRLVATKGEVAIISFQ